jgi:hypothetical protein
MVFVSSDNPEEHDRFIEAIEKGLESAKAGDALVTKIISRSGYGAATGQEAVDLLTELRQLYLDGFEKTKK